MQPLAHLNWQNWDVLSVGIATAAIGILGFVAYFNNRKSITNKSFLLFAWLTSVYGIFNYANYQVTSPIAVLWLLRLTLFAAVWHAFSLFQLFYVFPKETTQFPRWYKFFVVPVVIATSILTLTSLVFSKVSILAEVGGVTNPERGPAIALFGLVAVSLVIGSIAILVRKLLKSKEIERQQFRSIIIGTLLTFSLIIVFNVVLPVVFNNVVFVPLAPVFILPFIAYTAYAIIKYHLLDIKLVATEILTFAISIGLLFEVLISADITTIIFRLVIFLLVLTAGILLIKSVRREVEQREQLQKLTVQLEAANVQLKDLDQARADFITLTSHQLRTPPATIKWYLAAILSGDYGSLTPELQTAIGKAEITNNALISLIDDLLNASRIERGKLEFLFDPVNLNELAKFTVEQLFPQAHMKGLNLVYKAPTELVPEVTADKEKIRQVINNFIDNAIKYSQKGDIVVTVHADDAYVMVEVTDTGKGMDPASIPQLFHKYTRGGGAATHGTGIGIGLYVAKIVVENHRGEIGATSPGVGKGSTFFFKIPIKNDLPHTKIMDLVAEQKKEPAAQ